MEVGVSAEAAVGDVQAEVVDEVGLVVGAAALAGGAAACARTSAVRLLLLYKKSVAAVLGVGVAVELAAIVAPCAEASGNDMAMTAAMGEREMAWRRV